jgi:hypothetical protein
MKGWGQPFSGEGVGGGGFLPPSIQRLQSANRHLMLLFHDFQCQPGSFSQVAPYHSFTDSVIGCVLMRD